MALSAGDRQKVTDQLMRDNEAPLGAMTKADLRTAVNATDDWIDANQASWIATLPASVQSATTGTQKTWIFSYVLMMRIGKLRVEGD